MHILEQQRCGHLYFVDQLAHITTPLAQDLASRGYQHYSVLTADCGQLDLSADGRHLVIIAGVGGRALIEMLQSLQQRYAANATSTTSPLRFIVCATNYIYDLREYLVGNAYQLIGEEIVSDRGREYEVIEVELSQTPVTQSVSLIGAMWQSDNPQHQQYQQRLLGHYHRQAIQRDSPRLQRIITAYEHCFNA